MPQNDNQHRIRVPKRQDVVHENVMLIIRACIHKRATDLTVFEALVLNSFPEFVSEEAQVIMEEGTYNDARGNLQA